MRLIRYSASLVWFVGLGAVSATEVILDETFESLAPGSLHGQAGWVVERGAETSNASVQNRQACESSQALELRQAPGDDSSNWIAHRLEVPAGTSRLTVALHVTGMGSGRRSAQVTLGAGKEPWEAPLLAVRSHADDSTKWEEVFSYRGASGEWVNTEQKMGRGAWWEFKIDFDITKATYTFQVTPSGGDTVTIAKDVAISNKLPRGTMPGWIQIFRKYGQGKEDIVLVDDVKVTAVSGN